MRWPLVWKAMLLTVVLVSCATDGGLVFLQAPASAVTNVRLSPVQVRLTDLNGAPISAQVRLSLTNAGRATLSGTLTRPTQGGVATFDDLVIDRAGSGYQLTASASGSSQSSAPFEVVAWQAIGPFGGPVRAIASAPSAPTTVYAGTSGFGVFRSLDGGGTWARANAGIEHERVRSLAIDPADARHLLVSTDSGVFATADGGLSWSKRSATAPLDSLQFSGDDPSVLLAAVRTGSPLGAGVYLSADGGQSWTRIGLAKLDVTALAIAPSAPSTIYAGTSNGLFKSTNGGGAWTQPRASGLPARLSAIAVSPGQEATIYAGATSGGLFLSTDGGATFTAASGNGLATQPIAAISFTGAGELFAAAAVGEIFKSSDGVSFTALDVPATAQLSQLASIASQPGTVIVATDQGVLRTSDDGGRWAASNEGLSAIGSYAVTATPGQHGVLLAGAESIGIVSSLESADSWWLLDPGALDPHAIAFAPDNPSVVYARSGCAIRKSIDGGLSWGDAVKGLAVASDPTACALAISRSSSTTLYSVQQYALFRSSNGGGAWTNVTGGLPHVTLYSVAIDPGDVNTVYVGTGPSAVAGSTVGNGLYRTSNGGASWTQLTGAIANQNVYSLLISPTNAARLYAGSDGAIFVSADRGASWTKAAAPGAIRCLELDPSNAAVLYACGAGKLFKSSDSGASWSEIDSGLGGLNPAGVSVDAVDPHLLYVATPEAGVFRSYSAGE
jgi:photosystem II stability/assembly factor-like uncharacterized protein